MKRFVLLALCVILIQGMNLSAKGNVEAAEDDYVIKVGIGIVDAVTNGTFVALPGVPDSL